MGTPEFAVQCLEKILEDENNDVVAVFTKPDKLVGRKQILKFSEVKLKAQELGLQIIQPVVFGDDEVNFLKDLQPDVVVVVAYGKILPKSVLEIPKFGCVNVHASLLPRHRGASPIQASIICGDDVTGVSVIFLTEKLDSGDIIDQIEVEIGRNETTPELSRKLAKAGASLICRVLVDLSRGAVKAIAQNDDFSTYAPILTKESGIIDFKKSAFSVHKLVCGLVPWPCAHCFLKSKMLKIYESVLLDDEFFNLECGEVLNNKKRFIVGCGEGVIEFLKVQLEGKKIMTAADFLNGLRFDGKVFLN